MQTAGRWRLYNLGSLGRTETTIPNPESELASESSDDIKIELWYEHGHCGSYKLIDCIQVVCQFHLRGQCRFGDSCRNEHPLEEDATFSGASISSPDAATFSGPRKSFFQGATTNGWMMESNFFWRPLPSFVGKYTLMYCLTNDGSDFSDSRN
jgi:hypothetical protein